MSNQPEIFKIAIRNVDFGENVKVVEPCNLYECKIGANTFVGPFTEIQKDVVIGEHCKIQSHTFICELVTIGNHCFIGHGVMFINDLFSKGGPAGGDKNLWKQIMNVPFVDLKLQYQSIKKQIDTAIENVITETAFIGGKYVNQFEKDFATLYGVKHCISCANGTDSLYIIMKMLGIGKGDEVITVANSWISSSETISQTGATPVFVDIDAEYYSINEKLIEAKITAKTKAIMPVHLQGQMCDIETIKSICDKHQLFLIEDCAQSHLSEYNNIRAGLRGIAASFSFYPGKNLGAYGHVECMQDMAH